MRLPRMLSEFPFSLVANKCTGGGILTSAILRAAPLVTLLLAALLFLPSVALAQSPPGAVSSVSLTRADGTVTASWDVVSGATKYHITYSSNNGASWSLAALNHTQSSITFDADNAKTYIVGVRAGNDDGWGGWKNSPAAAPYNAPQLSPPGAVSSVSVTRSDGSLTASWNAADGATSYHVTYTGNGAQSWQLAALGHTGSSITISVDNAKTYIVGVRAKNSAGGSDWRNSSAAAPYTPPTPTPTPPGAPTSVSTTRADGTLTASWDAVSGATAYHVTYTDNNAQSWQLAALSHTESSITISVDNAKTYIVGVRAKNSAGGGNWRNSPSAGPYTPPVTLTPSGITDTTATIAVGNHSGDWYYQTSGGSGGAGAQSNNDGNCQGPVNGAQTTITGLDPDTSYTISIYGGQCTGGAMAQGQFQTQQQYQVELILTNLTAESVTITPNPAHWSSTRDYWLKGATTTLHNLCHGPFTGSTHIGGLLPQYTFDFYMHSTSACLDDPVLGHANFIAPFATLNLTHISANSATLELGGWTQSEWYYRRTEPSGDTTCHAKSAGDATITLTNLQASTQYAYWAHRDSDCAANNSLLLGSAPGITFTTASLAASEVGATTARLTVNGSVPHQGWWYGETGIFPTRLDGGPFKCHYAGTGNTVIARGMLPNNGNSAKPFTWNAYSDSRCTREIGSADVNTTTPTLNGIAVAGGVYLTLNDWGTNDGNWNYRIEVITPHGAGGNPVVAPHACSGAVTGASTTVAPADIPPLPHAWSYYYYNAYSRSDCHYGSIVAVASWASLPLGSLSSYRTGATTATITLSNNPGQWWYQANTAPHATCQGPVSNSTESLSGLTTGTDYTYSAYALSGCAQDALIASSDSFTAGHRPPGEVRHLNSASIGGTNYLLWDAPLDSGSGGDSLTYEAQCLNNNAWVNMPNVNHNNGSVIIPNQSCGNSVTYRVRAKNVVYGEWVRKG